MRRIVRQAAAAVGLIGVVSARLSGQPIVASPWCASCGAPGLQLNTEPKIVVSLLDSTHVAVVYNSIFIPAPWGDRLFYATSIDGGNTAFHNQGELFGFRTDPQGRFLDSYTDPMAVANHTGTSADADLYVGGETFQDGSVGGYLFIARIPAGKLAAEESRQASTGRWDKTLMDIGPYGGTDVFFLTGLRVTPLATGGRLARSSDLKATTWNPEPQPQIGTGASRAGYAHVPVAVRHPPHAGRLFCSEIGGQGENHPTYALLSDDGGNTWAASITAASTGAGSLTTGSTGTLVVDSSGEPINVPRGPEFLGSGFYCNGFSSAAADPGNTNDIVVGFSGTRWFPTDTPAPLIDVWIAVSHDGGASFVDTHNPPRAMVYHITDGMLHLPGENGARYTIMPTVAIDGQGGVCLMVVRNVAGTNDGRIVLARWKTLAALQAGAAPSVVPLTDAFSMDGIGGAHGGLGNDYYSLSASGRYVWCAYTLFSADGTRQVWVQRVDVCGATTDLADFNRDSTVNLADPLAYAAAFAAGSVEADVNRNGIVDAADAGAYMPAYGRERP